MHTLDNPDDLESLVAKEDVIYFLLHSPQDGEEILVSKLVMFTSVSDIFHFRNSSLKQQHHSLVHP